MLVTSEASLTTIDRTYVDPGNNLVAVDVHPDLTVLYGNRHFGNVDPRFSSPLDAAVNRIRLAGEAGCSNMVFLVPHGSDTFHDLTDDYVKVAKDGYDLWPDDLRPSEDVAYDRQDLPYIIDLPGDGLITKKPGEGLSMNGADCPAAVLYDQENKVLGVGHVGRRGAIVDILPKMLYAMYCDHGTQPDDVLVHFSPSIAPETHVLRTLAEPLDKPEWKPFVRPVDGGYGIDFVGFAISRLIEKWEVPEGNITPPPKIDVGTDPDFFSLTQHQASGGAVPNGRNAFVAIINQ